MRIGLANGWRVILYSDHLIANMFFDLKNLIFTGEFFRCRARAETPQVNQWRNRYVECALGQFTDPQSLSKHVCHSPRNREPLGLL
jgi:hypothetical protein